MRGKKAKVLRRVAKRVAAALPERELVNDTRGFTVNNPKSVRGIYRRWKKQVPKGVTPFKDMKK